MWSNSAGRWFCRRCRERRRSELYVYSYACTRARNLGCTYIHRPVYVPETRIPAAGVAVGGGCRSHTCMYIRIRILYVYPSCTYFQIRIFIYLYTQVLREAEAWLGAQLAAVATVQEVQRLASCAYIHIPVRISTYVYCTYTYIHGVRIFM